MSTTNHFSSSFSDSSSSVASFGHLSSTDTQQLQDCLNLIKSIKTQELAKERYGALRDRLTNHHPEMLALMDMMWSALIASHRSASVWERLCQSEQRLTDRMAEPHVQMHQNYLRLAQEL